MKSLEFYDTKLYTKLCLVLANFYGPNTFGGNGNQADQTYISNNPDASFVVVPILGRRTLLSLNYYF